MSLAPDDDFGFGRPRRTWRTRLALNVLVLMAAGSVWFVFRFGYLASVVAFLVLLTMALLWDRHRDGTGTGR